MTDMGKGNLSHPNATYRAAINRRPVSGYDPIMLPFGKQRRRLTIEDDLKPVSRLHQPGTRHV